MVRKKSTAKKAKPRARKNATVQESPGDHLEMIGDVGEELLEQILSVASGETRPRAVVLGQNDFIPWKRGISL